MASQTKTSQTPIKVYEPTKQRVRYAATMLGCTKAEFVELAVAEYLGRHAAEVNEGLGRARAALGGGLVDSVPRIVANEES